MSPMRLPSTCSLIYAAAVSVVFDTVKTSCVRACEHTHASFPDVVTVYILVPDSQHPRSACAHACASLPNALRDRGRHLLTDDDFFTSQL